MKSVVRWLARDRVPAYAVSYHKVNLWARQPGDGQMAIALVNASFDPAEDLVLAVRTQAERVRVFDMDAAERVVDSHGQDGPYRCFRLPRVEAWSVRLVVAVP
jgi:hypothetical protein